MRRIRLLRSQRSLSSTRGAVLVLYLHHASLWTVVTDWFRVRALDADALARLRRMMRQVR